jgi:exonuclease III
MRACRGCSTLSLAAADLGIYLGQLQEAKPVVLIGDLNCVHQDIDAHRKLKWPCLTQVSWLELP